MSRPIPSTPASASGTPAVNDLMARLNSQAGQGTDTDQAAFSRWLEKHALVSTPGASSGSANAKATATASASPLGSPTFSALTPNQVRVPQAATPPAAGASSAAARASEQAGVRARQQAAQQVAAQQARAQAGNANANTSPKAPTAGQGARNPAADAAAAKDGRSVAHADRGDRAERNATASADGTGEASGTTEAEATEQERRFTTALGDGTALVRELTPPATIQPGDAAGMMAWLASLTQGQGVDPETAASGTDTAAQGGEPRATTAGAADRQAQADARTLGTGTDGSKTAGKPLARDLITQGPAPDATRTGQDAKTGASTEVERLAALGGGQPLPPNFKQALNEAAAAGSPATGTLNTPLQSPEFSQHLADQVSLWVSTARTEGPLRAELHLNPAEMGPIHVKIAVDGQSAQVDFAAAVVETRQAIEASLGHLSAALDHIGLTLSGGDVSSQTAQQQFAQSEQGRSTALARQGERDGDRGADDDSLATLGVQQVSVPRPGRLGGLDLYA